MTRNDISEGENDEESDSVSAVVSDESDRHGDTQDDGSRIVSIFVGNLADRTGPGDIKNLFESFGIAVDHIDMKVCFAFAHCPWVPNLPEVVNSMQGSLFEHSSKIPKIEITKGDGNVRRREEKRHQSQSPSATLFVVGFDPNRTSEESIIAAFSNVAIAQKVLIRRNFCFVKFGSIAEAARVREEYHGKDVSGRTLSVEFSSGGDSIGDRRDQPISSSVVVSGRSRDFSGGGVGNREREGDRGYENDRHCLDRGDRYSSHSSESNFVYSERGDNRNNANLDLPYTNQSVKRSDCNDSNRNGEYYQGYGMRKSCERHNDEQHDYRSSSNDRDRGRSRAAIKSQGQTQIHNSNRSRSRERDRLNLSYSNRGEHDGQEAACDRADRLLNGSIGGFNRPDTPRRCKVDSGSSISVITLPFPVSGGRFIYEHSDGQREYVQAVFSSTVGNTNPLSSTDTQYNSDRRNNVSRVSQRDSQLEEQKKNSDDTLDRARNRKSISDNSNNSGNSINNSRADYLQREYFFHQPHQFSGRCARRDSRSCSR